MQRGTLFDLYVDYYYFLPTDGRPVFFVVFDSCGNVELCNEIGLPDICTYVVSNCVRICNIESYGDQFVIWVEKDHHRLENSFPINWRAILINYIVAIVVVVSIPGLCSSTNGKIDDVIFANAFAHCNIMRTLIWSYWSCAALNGRFTSGVDHLVGVYAKELSSWFQKVNGRRVPAITWRSRVIQKVVTDKRSLTRFLWTQTRYAHSTKTASFHIDYPQRI